MHKDSQTDSGCDLCEHQTARLDDSKAYERGKREGLRDFIHYWETSIVPTESRYRSWQVTEIVKRYLDILS